MNAGFYVLIFLVGLSIGILSTNYVMTQRITLDWGVLSSILVVGLLANILNIVEIIVLTWVKFDTAKQLKGMDEFKAEGDKGKWLK